MVNHLGGRQPASCQPAERRRRGGNAAARPGPPRPSAARPGPARSPPAPSLLRQRAERSGPARRAAEAEGMAPASSLAGRGGNAGPGVARGGLGAGGSPHPPVKGKGVSAGRPGEGSGGDGARPLGGKVCGGPPLTPRRCEGSAGPSPENPSSGGFYCCYCLPRHPCLSLTDSRCDRGAEGKPGTNRTSLP